MVDGLLFICAWYWVGHFIGNFWHGNESDVSDATWLFSLVLVTNALLAYLCYYLGYTTGRRRLRPTPDPELPRALPRELPHEIPHELVDFQTPDRHEDSFINPNPAPSKQV